jgi:hypothetical protein
MLQNLSVNRSEEKYPRSVVGERTPTTALLRYSPKANKNCFLHFISPVRSLNALILFCFMQDLLLAFGFWLYALRFYAFPPCECRFCTVGEAAEGCSFVPFNTGKETINEKAHNNQSQHSTKNFLNASIKN